MRNISVGVVGCGLIAQVMHLPSLSELRERYRIKALADSVPGKAARVAKDYNVETFSTDYRKVIEHPDVEAILILTSGDHAPIVRYALEAKRHVFVEKPMCFGVRSADQLIEISTKSNLCLMVGYMKWFDPVFQEAKIRLKDRTDLRLVQLLSVQTAESFYFRHHRLHVGTPNPALLQQIRDARAATLEAELPEVPASMRDIYVDVLLDSAIHDLYVLRGLIGDPSSSVHCRFWANGRGFHMTIPYDSNLEAHYDFVQFDTVGRYIETVSCFGDHGSLRLDFPSPYLRNAPTQLSVEGESAGGIVRSDWVGSYEEAFKQELVHFYECICTGKTPLSSAIEARKDILLMQTAIRSAIE